MTSTRSGGWASVGRHIAAVVVGYVVFAAASVALFAFSGRDPHAWYGWGFFAVCAVAGCLYSMAAGWVAGLIGGGRPMTHARTVAICVAAVAIVSWLARPGAGYVWSQAVAVFLLAPAVLVGGLLRTWQTR